MFGAILPGISSGVLMVVFGIYEKIVASILNFFKDVKSNTKFLFPIILGIGIGIISFGNILRILFETCENEMKILFIGLILGGIPTLIKTANANKGFRLHYLLYSLTAFIITLFLLQLEKNFTYNVSSDINFLYLIMSGFIMSVGIVVPGISSTALLMSLGIYNTYLQAISIVNLYILIPMGVGLVVGGIIFLFIIKYFLDNYHQQTYYSIIGFVLSSIIVLLPDTISIFSIIFFALGIFISNNIEGNKS